MPVRFGVGAILAVMTAFAALFGALKYCDVHPIVYLFFGTLGMATCGVQMRFGDVPRGASVLAGAAFLPAWAAIWMLAVQPHVLHRMSFIGSLLALPVLLAAGAFLGYLTGTLIAGIFLTMDSFERWLESR